MASLRAERPMLYGVSGYSRWLLDASMVIWNVVGLLALVGLVRWLRSGTPETEAPAETPSEGRRRVTVDVSGAAQQAHARAVTGDMTSEEILARELARSPLHHAGGEPPTSEDILAAELARSQGRQPQSGIPFAPREPG